ncbi:unnamed protein product [Durusdinium trenchii]|uniref:Uncharacterized protein n=1 Tax=Durusdinium trenchii TaxID=1381693 RepID=A0ABP0KUG3_9DINO
MRFYVLHFEIGIREGQWGATGSLEDAETVTDELGMSEKDRQEKEEWREKRRKGREDAIERMKMKERDAKKEKERRELEKFKEDNPQAYEDMLAQKREDERQAAEQKKRERLLQAAWERKRRIEAGEDPDEDTRQAPSSAKGKKGKASGSWYSTIAALIIMAVVGGIGYIVATGTGAKGGSGSGRSKGKKKTLWRQSRGAGPLGEFAREQVNYGQLSMPAGVQNDGFAGATWSDKKTNGRNNS